MANTVLVLALVFFIALLAWVGGAPRRQRPPLRHGGIVCLVWFSGGSSQRVGGSEEKVSFYCMW